MREAARSCAARRCDAVTRAPVVIARHAGAHWPSANPHDLLFAGGRASCRTRSPQSWAGTRTCCRRATRATWASATCWPTRTSPTCTRTGSEEPPGACKHHAWVHHRARPVSWPRKSVRHALKRVEMRRHDPHHREFPCTTSFFWLGSLEPWPQQPPCNGGFPSPENMSRAPCAVSAGHPRRTGRQDVHGPHSARGGASAEHLSADVETLSVLLLLESVARLARLPRECDGGAAGGSSHRWRGADRPRRGHAAPPAWL